MADKEPVDLANIPDPDEDDLDDLDGQPQPERAKITGLTFTRCTRDFQKHENRRKEGGTRTRTGDLHRPQATN